MIKLKSLIKESLDLGRLEDDYNDIKLEIEQEFQSGQKHQSWKLIPARDLIYLWVVYAKYGRVDEEKIVKIWDILKELVIKILLNTYEWQDENPEFYGKEKPEDITDEDRERHAWFISDLSGNKYVRSWSEEGGNARYSDCHQTLGKYLLQSYSSKTPEELLMNVDKILNFVHGLGNMAKWFVEGGTNTLDKIRDYQAKGITLQGKLSEELITSFENQMWVHNYYVEIFKNPTRSELKSCMENDPEIGVILTNKDVYVWNRMKALHVPVMERLRKFGLNTNECLPLLVNFKEDPKVYIHITDASVSTKWYGDKKIKRFLVNHPFFKYRKIEDVSYFDEDIRGKWNEPYIDDPQ